jgi:hypothetical protein
MSLCEFQTYAANRTNPAEYCDNEAVEGEEFCEYHMPHEPDPDEWRDYMLW